ncbi:MAG: DEAD/DEAH box helicase [Candidatus Obscuribacterales bacterium]|nr:DEAD/DEAH box helicase [Candidatus Obscuribacterales bacterium]
MNLAALSPAALSWAHPLTRDWFLAKFGSPTEPQEQGWPAILAGKTTLISAPTGSGKTLAAFLACVDKLVCKAVANELKNETSVVYVSPLKALSNDIQKNLDGPLAEIKELAESRGIAMAEIRTAVRSGDTPIKDRQAMLKNCPHILVTTPESLYILLTADKSRQMLATVETIIVDEIHAVADDKRGAHLSLTLERLTRLARKAPNRIGLSATQKPIELVAQFLTGAGGQTPVIVNIGHRRQMDIAIELPKMPLAPVASQELSAENFDRIAQLVKEHRSTLVFVNTRKQAERFALQLGARLGEDAVACHHGSLSRHVRLAAEQRLKDGDIQVLIATASLELGIDIGFIDLVCQVNSVKTIATALQRIGRAGHWRGAIPKGRLFPYTRDELVQTAALVRAINHGDLDKLEIPECPIDILAQQIVAMAAVEDLDEELLFDEVKRAYPYRNLTREKFTQVIEMLADGISSKRGRYGAYLLRDQVNGVLKARRGARLAAITSGGAIPETAIYGVVEEPDGKNVGTLDEHFAIDSHRGDVFTLGSTSWRIRRIDNVGGKVYVEDAHGAPPSVPFWFGEAPARSDELSRQVSELRENIDRLTQNIGLEFNAQVKRTAEVQTAVDWLKSECGVDDSGAEQLIEYVVQGRAILTAVPTVKQVIAERFFDEGGGMQLILHAPFGGRINRAWGLALRKKFCRSFNLELQAAATEDGISIALAEQHSFPLGDVFYFLASETVRHTLEQASLQSPIFATRWRWDAMRSLALLRFQGGKKVQPYLQRLRSDDLLAAVFPGAAACQDNNPGDVELPDHPLIEEVMKDVLTEAMDLEGLESIINDIKCGAIKCIAVDTPTPSQFAAEIINANVYAYLDDAGIEERRTRAVQMRRIMPGSVTGELGQLDPAAIEKVVEQAWPDIQNADELHDLMQTTFVMPEHHAFLSEQPTHHWLAFFESLRGQKRATVMTVGDNKFWVNAEKILFAKLIWPEATFAEQLTAPGAEPSDRQLAVLNCMRGWVSIVGPTLVQDLAQMLSIDERDVEIAFAQMESDGAILRGEFTGRKKLSNQITGVASLPLSEYEWCERRLLARIHKLTLATLRKGVEPVTAGIYARWLTHWQHLAPGSQLAGERGLLQILKQLQGFEIPANAWESQVLAQRVKNYSPDLLDNLCMKGTIGWGRLSIHPALALSPEFVSREETDLKSAFLSHAEGENKYSPENFKLPQANKVTAFRKKSKEKEAVVAEENADFQNSAQVINLAEAGLIKRVVPSSVAPIAFYIRDDADWMTTLAKTPDKIDLSGLSTPAQAIEQFLRQRGASFFADIVRGTALTQSRAEIGLWELVTAGVVSADGFENLRSLIDPQARNGHRPGKSKRFRDFNYGRWTLLHAHNTVEKCKGLESMCRVLLSRYGVVFRDVVQRESNLPPWRELLAAFRQMEDKGEVRGGRFVLGFIGEQFALPEAVDSLRAAKGKDATPVTISASPADPLNLIGTLLPGDRISASSVKSVEISC